MTEPKPARGEQTRNWSWFAHRLLSIMSLALFGWLVVRADWRTLEFGRSLWSGAALYVVSATIRPLMWVQLMHTLHDVRGDRAPLQRLLAWRETSRARATRYVPGRLLNWSARYVIAQRAGYGRTVAVESIALDSVLPPAVLLCVAGAALGAEIFSVAVGLGVLVMGYLALIWLVTVGRGIARRRLHSVIASSSHRRLSRFRLALAGEATIAAGGLHIAMTLYFAWALTRTAAFATVTLSMTELESADLGFVAAAGAAGGLAGQLFILAPMGLGVREGVATAMLSLRGSVTGAATAVASTRLLQLAAEIPALLITEAICLAGGRKIRLPALRSN